MSRESRSVWERRVARWVRSGLSRDDFAAREGVKSTTLGWYRWFLGSAASKNALAKAPAFVEVEPIIVESAAERIEVALANGRVVRVPSSFADESLRRVLAIAEDQ